MKKNLFTCVLFLVAFFGIAICGSAQTPSITSFTPQSAYAGASITITGSGFDAIAANNIVAFGSVQATVTGGTTSSLNVTVPNGAGYAPLSVTVNGLKSYSSQPFTRLFSAGQLAFNSFQFMPGFFHDAISSLTIADIDGDGIADFGNSKRGSQMANVDTIVIYRNTSNIGSVSFAEKINVVISNSFAFLTFYFEDIDLDGRPDLIVLNESGKFSVYRNTSVPGNISFTTPVFVDLAGENGRNAIFGDFDIDGKIDIGIITSGNFLRILKNNSTPGNIAVNATPVFTVSFTSTLIKTSDLDGDHKLDIVGLDPGTDIISVFVNTSAGSSVAFLPIDLSLPAAFGTFDLSDLDQDGKPEIVTATTSLSIFKNTSAPGSVSFAPRDDRAISISNIIIHDMDGDGKPDIVGKLAPDSTAIVPNTSVPGSISFFQPINYVSSYHASIYNRPLLVYDLDNDAKPEILLILAADFTNSLAYLKNKTGEPRLTSFTPTNGTGAINIHINGYNLGSTTAISIGGTPVSSFTVINANTLEAIVSSGSFGNVVVTTLQGADSIAAFNTPVIRSFSPNTAGPGGFQSLVTIHGINFTGATAVTFGGVPAARFTVLSDTVITATVSDTGGTGSIAVTTMYGTATREGFQFAPAGLVELCPAIASATLHAYPGFLFYRWKVNSGDGVYTTITENSNYSGSATATLQLNNIPSSWYGYTYHYQVSSDGVTWATISGAYYFVKFVNRWTGAVGAAWENPANWSCGTVPDPNTDVIIPAGAAVTLNSNTTVRSLTVGAGASLTVSSGFNITITH